MSLWQDVRFAVRLLIKDRWFAAAAAIALALGLGANTAVFTFVNAVLIRGLPFNDPDRIISLGTSTFGDASSAYRNWTSKTGATPPGVSLGSPWPLAHPSM